MSYVVVIAHPQLDGNKIEGGERSYKCGCDHSRLAYPRHFDGKYAGAYCDACWTKWVDERLEAGFHQ